MRNPNSTTPTTDQDTPQGLLFAGGAYLLWGFLPLYMKLLSHLPTAEVIAHRVIWSVPIAAVVLILLGRTATLREAFRNPRMLAMGCVTAALISLNWGIYVYAITSGNALDAAIGYYINPLFSVFLAAVLLGEKLNKAQLIAVAFAVAAVLVLVVDAEQTPWLAFGMMLTWGFYALAKKSLPIGPNQGFLMEVIILLPVALGYAVFLASTGKTHFLVGNAMDTWLLLGCGAVTAIPLLLYSNGAKLLRLSTIGIMQYIAPTLILLNAVFIFGEPFGRARAIALPLIWIALIIYSASMIRQMRRNRTS
ncbi:EamA family transporter RarD [Sulfitobacter donghicola]|uniref:Permease n=1 Tax=Sulfitobacter donghicola DSW-25 = KCTC 12864 = JCM 14565 TaxID=1300350 RepID=A0A073ILM4_9RHOB|nr:EamA family transporter RarD [Sulfitobacter donghicola]KEJ90401.1 permease [Sulfitobacter donghicola DSW-25 = KCTC 12864 = JCM 14565]KIN67630.1 RarD protein [Sulfitobacter donghicola DSW-25 = KCTC 12864 = JCM 14565]